MTKRGNMGGKRCRMRPISVAVAALASLGGSAWGFEIDTGNPDLSMRWDNTIRYNLAQRVQARNDKFGNSPVSDEGTYSFDRGDFVANRLDILSEFDLVYKKKVGMRVSAAAWYDTVYGSESHSNPNPPLVNIPSYINHQYTDYVKRFYAGPSGEWLDAFVFGNFDIGTVPTSVKAGRYNLYWGESLFLNGNLNGIAYSQSDLDLQKGFATPGTEAKELFRPLNQISGQAQITDTLSVAAEYFFEWSAARYPEGGTYLGPVDFVFNGPERFLLAQLPVTPRLGPLSGAGVGFSNGGAINPDQNNGEGGVAVRWSPDALDGTLGFYYRRFADKLPQVLVTKQTLSPNIPGVGRVPLANGSTYNLLYADGIDLFGISLAKNVAGVSIGAELSYRHNTPLLAPVLGNASAFGTPTAGNTPGPIGDTYHGLINAVGILPKTALWDTANYAAELTWAHWAKVTSGANLFQAEGYPGCTFNGQPGNKWDGCATKNFWGLALAFTPTWFQVFPGVDIQAPVTLAAGLSGNAPTVFGGNQGNGNYTIGIGADIYQKYRIDLKYIDWFGRYKDNGTALTGQNGFTTLLSDRGFVSLTFKTTF